MTILKVSSWKGRKTFSIAVTSVTVILKIPCFRKSWLSQSQVMHPHVYWEGGHWQSDFIIQSCFKKIYMIFFKIDYAFFKTILHCKNIFENNLAFTYTYLLIILYGFIVPSCPNLENTEFHILIKSNHFTNYLQTLKIFLKIVP